MVSHVSIFNPALWAVAPLTFSLVQLSPPFTGQFFKMTTFCIAFYASYLSTSAGYWSGSSRRRHTYLNLNLQYLGYSLDLLRVLTIEIRQFWVCLELQVLKITLFDWVKERVSEKSGRPTILSEMEEISALKLSGVLPAFLKLWKCSILSPRRLNANLYTKYWVRSKLADRRVISNTDHFLKKVLPGVAKPC
jgi:hypothetical protein